MLSLQRRILLRQGVHANAHRWQIVRVWEG